MRVSEWRLSDVISLLKQCKEFLLVFKFYNVQFSIDGVRYLLKLPISSAKIDQSILDCNLLACH